MSLSGSLRRVLDQVGFNTSKLAQTLTYNINGGASTDMPFVPVNHDERETDEPDGLYRVREKSVAISSTAGVGIAAPDVQDTVTIAGEEWAITAFSSDFVASHTLQLERRELLKKYRR